jgi:hypothetical protein
MKEKKIELCDKIFNICNGLTYEDGFAGPVVYDGQGLSFLKINQTETGRFNLMMEKVDPKNEQSASDVHLATILPRKVKFKGSLENVLMMVEHVRDNQI